MVWRVSCCAAELGCIPNRTVGKEYLLGKDFSLGQTGGALLWGQEAHPG